MVAVAAGEEEAIEEEEEELGGGSLEEVELPPPLDLWYWDSRLDSVVRLSIPRIG